MSDQHPIIGAISKAQYDLTSAQAWLAEVKRQAAALGLEVPTSHVCVDCDLSLGSSFRLAEHRYLAHDGPEPEHWKRSEELAESEPDAETAALVAHQKRAREALDRDKAGVGPVGETSP